MARNGMVGRLVAAGAALALASAPIALAQEKSAPQYGGALEIATEHTTRPPQSWDPADFPWKLNHDVGFYAEQLIAGDLTKSVGNGGTFRFTTVAWLPPEVQRGELAERWELVDEPLSAVFHLRKGIMWPAKPGVMESRELTAEDIVFNFNRQKASPKQLPGNFDHIERAEARDRYTVVFYFKEFNAEWDARFGYGTFSAIIPPEMVEAGAANWRNATGTGPFKLENYIQSNSQLYVRNPDYWDKITLDGKEYKLPFVDRITLRLIPDEAAQHAALRTGKLDMLQLINWRAVDSLKKSAPDLQWDKRLLSFAQVLALRVDMKPFDDRRVRRALNMAVNKQEIVEQFYNGNAEIFDFPIHKEWTGYYRPLEEMPASVRELFVYDPEKAKKLLAEAGYPNGFSFKVQVCPCRMDHMDLASMVAAYLEQIGVRMEIQPMESGAYTGALLARRHTAGFLYNQSHSSPTSALRINYVSGQTYNASMYSNPDLDRRVREMFLTRDEDERRRLIQDMAVDMLDEALSIFLPTPYVFQAWWPWVKNFHGELYAGAHRPPPIYARIWIDQELKKKMGY